MAVRWCQVRPWGRLCEEGVGVSLKREEAIIRLGGQWL